MGDGELFPVVTLFPDELPQGNGAKPKVGKLPCGDIIQDGQRLIKLPKDKAAKRPPRQAALDWVAAYQEARADLSGTYWGNLPPWEKAFWHNLPADLFWRQVKIPRTLSHIPREALVAMSLRFQGRLLPAACSNDVETLIPTSFYTTIARGEEACRGILGFLDDLRNILEHRRPGITASWYTHDPRAFRSLENIVEFKTMCDAFDVSTRSLALAILTAHEANPRGAFTLRLAYQLASAILANRFVVMDSARDWLVDFQMVAGVPGGVRMPSTWRFGWRLPEVVTPGYTLYAIANDGQLIYANRQGKRITEGAKMDFHPVVKGWGWGVTIPVTPENAAYLLQFENDPPANCPWSWWEAYGDGSYDEQGRHKSPMLPRVVWA